MFRAFFVTVITFAYIFLVGTPFLIHAWLTKNTDPLYRIGVLGAKLALRLAGVRIVVQGREKIATVGAVVYMPNHQSNCDPPAIFTILPPVLVLGKKEFFRVPVLGRAVRLRGFIPVDRKNHEQAQQAVEEAVESLKRGRSFLAYPEGTRSRDGRLQPFKRGVFVMAIKAGVPIVPISVSGGIKIARKGELAIHPGELQITFHDPIPTQGYSVADRHTVMDRVRQAILTGLAADELPLEKDSQNLTVESKK